MKKLLLCTLIISLGAIGNITPKIRAPESNPEVIKIDKAIGTLRKQQQTLSKKLEKELAEQEKKDRKLGRSVKYPPVTSRKEIRNFTKEIQSLTKQRQKLLKKHQEEINKRVKEGKKEGMAY